MADDLVLYDTPQEHVAVLTLNRPDTRNAQDTALLYALNEAFDRAAHDDAIKVIILAANGPHFSSGHDLREAAMMENTAKNDTVGTWSGFLEPGQAGMHAREKEVYLGFSERWRNLPKPTIAAVQGKCISGGLMLVWPCDLIVAAEDAQFQDNTLMMGIAGVEYFVHTYEVGARKAKEMLFTAGWLSAQEAERLGMVNKVVPTERLLDEALAMAARITDKNLYTLKIAKEAVHLAEDAAGRQSALQGAFALHQLLHAQSRLLHGIPIDPSLLKPGVYKKK